MFIKPNEVVAFLSSQLIIMPGFKIADFGCGGGYFTTLLADKVGPEGKIFAIDIQEDAIKETKELAEMLGYKNIEFHQADLKKTAFEENFFDVVFLSSVLFQNNNAKNNKAESLSFGAGNKKSFPASFPAFEEIIKEAKRVLKNKGSLVILEPSVKSNFLFGDIVEKDKLLTVAKKENLRLVLDKEFGENYYLLILER